MPRGKVDLHLDSRDAVVDCPVFSDVSQRWVPASEVNVPTDSPKYREAAGRLSDEQKSVFERLVKEYEYLTALKYGRGYVAYEVLADLVLAGWRPTAEPDPSSKI
jgi:hypothetical protein